MNALRNSDHSERGIALLLVVVLVSAILSISIGIFNVMIGEFRISGDAVDSFRALYAVDEGLERTLYRDRQQAAICPLSVFGDPCETVSDDIASGACYTVSISKFALSPQTRIAITGQYQCGTNPFRIVRRAFKAVY